MDEALRLLNKLDDSHTQHILLRYCLDACRLVHFLRGTEYSPLQGALEQAITSIRKALASLIGAEAVSDLSWLQGTLPLRFGGLGVKDPEATRPAARIAAILCYLQRGKTLGFPEEVVCPPRDWVSTIRDLESFLGPQFGELPRWATEESPTNVSEEHLEQRWWSRKIQRVRFQRLQLQSALRDRNRLRLESMPFATSWMTVVPSVGLGHKLGNGDYQVLLKWWLGLKLSRPESGECPRCGDVCDPYGDHFVSCKHNQPVRRHHALRNALADVLTEVGIPCVKEVPIGGRRPADLGLLNFDAQGPLAVDLVCTHPGALSTGRNAEPAKPVAAAEKAKIAESEPLCHSHGWLFTPLGWHPWGGVGPHGAAFLSRVEKAVFGDLRGWPRRHAVLHFRSQVVFQLMRFIAHQLRAHEDMAMDAGEIDRSADVPAIPSEEQRPLPTRWDEPWDSDEDPME